MTTRRTTRLINQIEIQLPKKQRITRLDEQVEVQLPKTQRITRMMMQVEVVLGTAVTNVYGPKIQAS